MTAIYNENDGFAADWLENLIAAGHIAHGRVDRRSITDLTPNDVRGDGETHFFAGIGVWSYALRLAGWPTDWPRPWTGSCPCQPFSQAGAGGGTDDERHLWPAWFKLIDKCRPPVVFGEQVASPAGLEWLDAVYADLEGAGYAVGAADLCAAGVGAPHIRQRLYFAAFRLAYADDRNGRNQLRGSGERDTPKSCERVGRNGFTSIRVEAGSPAQRVGDPRCAGLARRSSERSDDGAEQSTAERAGGSARGLADHGGARSGRDAGAVPREEGEGAGERFEPRDLADELLASGATRGVWAAADWIPCSDGVSRPVEPGTFPLAHGVAGRVGRLRAYGNAINAEVAATFIRAVMEAL